MSRALTLLAGGLAASFIFACGNSDDELKKPVKAVVSGDLVRSTWMVQLAEPGKLDALASQPGWQAYHSRDYAGTLALGDGWAGTGRVHTELSALYRQAALLAANSYEQTYRDDQRREGDPAEVDYLLGVSYVIMGQADNATARLGLNGGSQVTSLAAADSAWAERHAAGEPVVALMADERLWPLPEPAVGGLPEPAPAPHHEIPEAIGDRLIKAADPTVLLQLAAWHEAAAILAIGAERTAALLAPWHLPCEPQVPVDTSSLILEDLFLSAYASSSDVAFAALGSEGDSPSPYGGLIEACTGEGSEKAQCAADAANQLRKQVESAMDMVGGGPSPNHRAIAAFAEAGALRAGVRAADLAGDRQAGGLLRIAAKDMSEEAVLEPVFLISLAAWDAGNRNPLRAQELLHTQLLRAPGLDAARYALDVLHLRVSRDSGPSMPMH